MQASNSKSHETDTNGLVADLQTSTEEWTRAVVNCSDDVFNTLRNDGTWSPAQVFSHLILTERGINTLLAGPSQSVEAGRTVMHERIGKGLKDTTRKLKAPSFLEPRAEHYNKQRLLDKFTASRATLEQILTTSQNLHNVFTSFAHPYFGLLTGYEWIHNVVLHADRHLIQFSNMINVSTGGKQTD